MKASTKTNLILSQVGTGKSLLALGIIATMKRKTLIIVPSEAIGQGMYDKISPYAETKFTNGE